MSGRSHPDGYALGGGHLPPVARDAVLAMPAGRGVDDRAVHAVIAEALIAGLPTDADGATDWRDAGPYVRANLAGHALRGGILARLVTDPGFLLAADPALLLPALDSMPGARSAAAAGAYRRAMAYLRDGPGRAAAALQLAARRAGAEQLADRIAFRGGLPWSTRWMLAPVEPDHQTLAVLPGPIEATWTGRRPDGTPVVAALSTTGAYGCWELAGGERILTGAFGRPLRPNGIGGLTMPDGRQLIVAMSYEGPLTLWDMAAGTPVALGEVRLPGVLQHLYTTAGAGGPRVVAATLVIRGRRGHAGSLVPLEPDRYTVAWWTVEGDPPRLVEMPRLEQPGPVAAAGRTAADDPAIVVTGSGSVIIDLRSGKRTRLRRARPAPPVSVAGGTLATWADSGRLRRVTADGQVHDARQRRYARTAVTTPSGLVYGGADGVLRLWDPDRAGSPPKDRPISTPVAAATTTRSDGQRLAVVAHGNGTVGGWDMADGFVQVTLQRKSAAVGVACVAPPGGPVLAVTVNQRGQVRVSDVDTGRTRHSFVAPAADPLPGTGAYRLPGRTPPEELGESLRAVAAAVTAGGQAIAVAAGHRGWLHRWDMLEGRELGRTFFGRSPEAVACADLGGRAVAVVGTGNNLMVYDLVSGEPLADHRVLTGELLRPMGVVDDIVAAVDTARRLHRWRLTEAGSGIETVGEPVPAHDDAVWTVSCARRAGGRPVAATGAVNGVVRVWDLIDGRLLHDIPVEDEVRVVSLADDLDLVVGMSANLAVFRLAPDPGPPPGLRTGSS